ncbi:MAG: N5-glutamine S-adenosyl-L-methionine-dependent methyltransferase [Syntrophorhabdaceae bacterium PtaU1.Bin034]|nr:MAG: N5-glutamine S-adenosyl-L-methionine-dependent methyltransferase [Syntrophorhabdaceae bacterium PtaU1.Bin034]
MKKSLAAIFLVLVMTILTVYPVHGEGDKDSTQKKPDLDVPYEPTSYGIAEAMLSMAEVNSKDLVYDLGCGDGRILVMAAKERGARGVGVDLDPERVAEAKKNAKAAGVSRLVRFYEQNLFDTDISQATAVMLYLWPEVNLRLRPKLLSDLRPGTRVVSHSHTMKDWEPNAKRRVESHNLYLFIIPANVTGVWEWADQDGSRTSLEVKQRFQKIEGSIAAGGLKVRITKPNLQGDALSFSAKGVGPQKDRVILFSGRVKGNVIEGKMTDPSGSTIGPWKATRDSATIRSIAE